MKEHEASSTSLVSAFSRAYHSQYDTPKIFDDFIAKELITAKESATIKENMIQGIQFFNKDIADKFKDHPDEILKWINQVQLSPTPLARAAFSENVLLNEILLGAEQYVLLGAGLDTFCFRHPEFHQTLEIFEMDHPSTQDVKLKKLKLANLETPTNLHFIPIDFTKSAALQSLISAGFKSKKTFFSLLGVSYYLSKIELTNLINRLFSLVPKGSSIVFDYPDENFFSEKGLSNRVENTIKMAAIAGEPMKSCYTYNELEKTLEQNGLLIYEHLTPELIQDQFFKNRDDYLSAFENIHYIHAVKQ